jgi:hypothetical protein
LNASGRGFALPGRSIPISIVQDPSAAERQTRLAASRLLVLRRLARLLHLLYRARLLDLLYRVRLLDLLRRVSLLNLPRRVLLQLLWFRRHGGTRPGHRGFDVRT